jgi:hypothetical protein
VAEARVEPAGPIAGGSRVTQLRVDGLRREETRYLVESVEPDRSLCLQSVGVKPASTIRYRLSPSNGGAILSCTIQVETAGLLRLVEARLRRDLERKLGETLETFKVSMEGH